jgi:hypothetical protein
MDELDEKIARAISREDGLMAGEASDFAEWHWEESLDHAKAARAAIESAGFVLMPKDQILRKMSKDEFSELMAGIKFKEMSDG